MWLGELRSTNPLRIPHPKIDKLACQAQGVGIIAAGDITLRDAYCTYLIFGLCKTLFRSLQFHGLYSITQKFYCQALLWKNKTPVLRHSVFRALGYSPCGEDSHALRLACKPPDLRAANANLIPRRFDCGASFEATSAPANAKRTPEGVLCVVKRLRKRYFLRFALRIRTPTVLL